MKAARSVYARATHLQIWRAALRVETCRCAGLDANCAAMRSNASRGVSTLHIWRACVRHECGRARGVRTRVARAAFKRRTA
eukprot:9964880-Lingulodinium_polyedra.AAC.1